MNILFLMQEPKWVGYEINDKGKLVPAKDGGRDDLKNKLKKGSILLLR